MLQRVTDREASGIGKGVYSAAEGVRLLNFHRDAVPPGRILTARTLARWLRGYAYEVGAEIRHAPPLWTPDYANDDGLELSFRDLIELRFVKTFLDMGLRLPTIRACFERAVEAVQDERPFSTRRFQTDGRTIFLEITGTMPDGDMIDLKRRQGVFRSVILPSLRDLDYEADAVARWFPLGPSRPSIVLDPARAFGRPVAAESGVPTEVLAQAVRVEGSPERVARLYDVTPAAVRDAVAFQQKLAA